MSNFHNELLVHVIRELIVPASPSMLEPMVHNYEDAAKKAFATRLHAAIDLIEAAPKGHGRKKWLAEKMEISPKGAGKWLNGDSIPETAKIPRLAEVVQSDPAKLLFGYEASTAPILRVAEPAPIYNEDPQLIRWITLWKEMTPHERAAVLDQIPVTRRLANGNQEAKTMEGGGNKKTTHRKT